MKQTQTAQYVEILLYPSSLNRLLYNKMSTTSVSELGYLFLISPVCNRIASELDVRDHTVLHELFLDDVKSYNTK